MSQFKQQSSRCEKHRKEHSILVVGEARYICEECALFEQQYRGKRLMEKESVGAYGEMVERRCRELGQKGKTVEVMKRDKLVELVGCVEEVRDRIVNDISSQFAQIKQSVSAMLMTKLSSGQKQQNSLQTPLLQILQAKTLQTKIMLQDQYQQKLQNYKLTITKQITKIQQAFKKMKDELQHGVTFNISVKDSFGFLFENSHESNVLGKDVRKSEENLDTEENLLDFSEFNIVQLPSYVTEPTFAKKSRADRMKTAACLEDSISICSMESMTKSTELTLPHIALSIFQPSESLLSDRSISCSSTISRKEISSVMPKPASNNSKTTLEICSTQELQEKLSSISPTIKIIKISDLSSLTNQEFLSLLKQKISRSFIHTLEFSNCNKLTEKILVDLKMFKCKSLKKFILKQCKEIKLQDKKVKEMVKRLESDGIKVHC